MYTSFVKVTARELRTRAAEILKAVDDGERVTITYRGHPVAEIRPLDREDAERSAEDAFGMWADHDDLKDPTAWVRRSRGHRLDRSS